MAIEDGFEPTTVGEMQLLNRIRELHIAMFEKGLNFGMSRFKPDETLVVDNIMPTLYLAAQLEAGWEQSKYKFGVTARTLTGMRTTDADSVSFGYYMSHEAMTVWPKQARAERLVEMHRQMIRHFGAIVPEPKR